jgi:hypothetical protein
MTTDTIKLIVVAVTMISSIFIAEDIFVYLVKLNRRMMIKKRIREFRAKQSVMAREKPIHVPTKDAK